MHIRNTAQHLVTDGDNNRSSPKVNVLPVELAPAEKMESENGSGAIAGSDSIVPGVDKGAALLLVIGEPSTEDEKTQILGEITRGR